MANDHRAYTTPACNHVHALAVLGRVLIRPPRPQPLFSHCLQLTHTRYAASRCRHLHVCHWPAVHSQPTSLPLACGALTAHPMARQQHCEPSTTMITEHHAGAPRLPATMPMHWLRWAKCLSDPHIPNLYSLNVCSWAHTPTRYAAASRCSQRAQVTHMIGLSHGSAFMRA